MTEYFVTPKDIIKNFLRARLTDPRARSEATSTESFTATAGQTSYTFDSVPSGTVQVVTSVTIDTVSQKAYSTFYVDYQNQKIYFTALTVGQEVEITYKYGTNNWIYTDKPFKDLSATAYPRISIMDVSGSGKRLGQYNAEVEGSLNFQIDIWAKKDQTFTISNYVYEGQILTEYISLQITKQFEENIDDLHPILYNYIPNSMPRDQPYELDRDSFHRILEINLKGLKIGRITL